MIHPFGTPSTPLVQQPCNMFFVLLSFHRRNLLLLCHHPYLDNLVHNGPFHDNCIILHCWNSGLICALYFDHIHDCILDWVHIPEPKNGHILHCIQSVGAVLLSLTCPPLSASHSKWSLLPYLLSATNHSMQFTRLWYSELNLLYQLMITNLPGS